MIHAIRQYQSPDTVPTHIKYAKEKLFVVPWDGNQAARLLRLVFAFQCPQQKPVLSQWYKKYHCQWPILIPSHPWQYQSPDTVPTHIKYAKEKLFVVPWDGNQAARLLRLVFAFQCPSKNRCCRNGTKSTTASGRSME